MTFNPTECYTLDRQYPLFTCWALKFELLFFPKEIAETVGDEYVDLTSKVYILMKRLGQDYETIMRMDSVERDMFVDIELKLIEKEKNSYKNK